MRFIWNGKARLLIRMSGKAAVDGRVVVFSMYPALHLGYSFLTRSVSQADVSTLIGLTLLCFPAFSDFCSNASQVFSELRDRDEECFEPCIIIDEKILPAVEDVLLF